MSDAEMILVLVFLVLLVLGVALMLAPVKSGEESLGLILRELEPHVGEENRLIDFRYSIRQLQEEADARAVAEDFAADMERNAPTHDVREDRASSEAVTHIGNEVFYLAATREVDGDNRQPGLWAKVIALNEGDERKARYQYIRLRADQLINKLSVPNPAKNGGTEEGSSEAKPLPESEPERMRAPDAVAGMGDRSPVLKRELVVDAITRRASIADLVESARLLRDFSVREYMSADDIRATLETPQAVKPAASSFFERYQHRTFVKVDDILERFEPDVVKHYLEIKRFPHEYLVDFFDEVVVVTILPDSSRTEFLVLAPGGDLGEEFSINLLASSRITELFLAAAEAASPLSLYVELDRLLERLRTG